jgi:molybdenum cofactor guanylyltransferase
MYMMGVVLCGGESLRMGTDKGLLHNGGTVWATLAAEKLAALGIPVVISVNDKQSASYQVVFPATRVVKDHPGLLIKGPLAGLLSVHVEYPEEDIFLLACDMPSMKTTVLQVLYETYLFANGAEAILFMNNGQAEPLSAIYSARALAKIAGMYQQQLLIKHSMKFMLEQLHVKYITATKNQFNCFTNFNTPDDLNILFQPDASA